MAFSVIFMTLFLVKDLPSYRESLLSLMGNESAVRWHRIADEVITTTSRYMIGNIVISLICATIYGTTALILGLPYPLALAVIAGILDMIPNIGSTSAGVIVGVVALSVSTTALIIFVIVIVVYQQQERVQSRGGETTMVIDTAAPATNAAEFRRQSSLVARKIALRICGPAIITNASGRAFAMVTSEQSSQAQPRRAVR